MPGCEHSRDTAKKHDRNDQGHGEREAGPAFVEPEICQQRDGELQINRGGLAVGPAIVPLVAAVTSVTRAQTRVIDVTKGRIGGLR